MKNDILWNYSLYIVVNGAFDSMLLRSFQVVALEGSFTKAAARLGLTQSAVSAHIRRLEEQAGHQLLARNTRSVALTPAGNVLLGYARAILRLNEDARARLFGSGPRDHIRVGSSDDFASSWLLGVLRAFVVAHPGVSIEVSVGNTAPLLERMNGGSLDLVVGSRCRGDQRGQQLWREPLVWAYARGGVLNSELPVPLALFPEPCPYRDAALAALADSHRDWRVVLVSPSVAGLLAAAAAEFAVTPVAQSLLSAQLQSMGSAEGFPDLPEVEFMVFTSSRDGPPALADLTDQIIRAARRL
jgi:DNA-binding transcriptional LysR family regulator